MIDVIVSDNCEHCHQQLDIMQRSFFNDEFRIINVSSPEFEKFDQREKVIGVPFVVVRGASGGVKYSAPGIHDGTQLRKIERKTTEPFNLRKDRVTVG